MRKRPTVSRGTNKGVPCWIVNARDNGIRHRSYHPTKAVADAKAGEIWEAAKGGNAAWEALPAKERAALIGTWQQAKRSGVELPQVLEEWRHSSPSGPRVRVSTAVGEYLAAKEAAERRGTYLKALRQALHSWMRGRAEQWLDEVTSAQIAAWVAARGPSAWSRATAQSRVRGFTAWALRKNYLRKDPCAELDKITVESKTPRILTAEEAGAWLAWCRTTQPDFMAYLILGLFVGVRPAEMQRLTWGDVDIAHARVTVGAGAAKVRQRRVTPLNATALAWLALVQPGEATDRICPGEVTLRRRRRALRAEFKVWQADILRHTCASMRMAAEADLDRIARDLGNSPNMLWRHYHALVTPEEAAKFWKIRPPVAPAGVHAAARRDLAPGGDGACRGGGDGVGGDEGAARGAPHPGARGEYRLLRP